MLGDDVAGAVGIARERERDHAALTVAQRVVEADQDRVAGRHDDDPVELAVGLDEALGVAARGELLLRRDRGRELVGDVDAALDHLRDRELLDQ
jgi:hypothetical protein